MNDIKYIELPIFCPSCGSTLEIDISSSGVKNLCCKNLQCNQRLINKLENFCGKKGLDIKGISKATLEKLIDWGWVNTYQDIFILNQHRDQWIKKAGFGIASVDKILNSIEESKNTTLDKVIAAAGIPEIGSRVAKDIASYYLGWEDFRMSNDYTYIDGIGEIMNNNLLSFNYKEIDYIVENYLDIQNNQKENNNNSLEGKTFCVTGKVHIYKNRAELTEAIESKGGRVVSSMSSKVDYLVNNDNTSTSAKNTVAKQAGIPIITEEELQTMFA